MTTRRCETCPSFLPSSERLKGHWSLLSRVEVTLLAGLLKGLRESPGTWLSRLQMHFLSGAPALAPSLLEGVVG